jgi:isoamylase
MPLASGWAPAFPVGVRTASLVLVALVAPLAAVAAGACTSSTYTNAAAGGLGGSITTTPPPPDAGSDATEAADASDAADAASDTTDTIDAANAADAGPPADAAPPIDAGPTDPGPFPLGATLGATALHLRVRADAATRVAVYLYAAATGVDEALSLPMTRAAAGEPWSADVSYDALAAAGLPAAPYLYGYRAWGPNWPYDPTWTKGSSTGFVADVDAAGNRFDPNKLLFDPYAREMSHDPLGPTQPSSAPFLTGATDRALDDGKVAPKAIAMPADTTSTGPAPARALKDDVIYEVHVRGLTMNDPSVPTALRGTFAGAALKASALAALRVTAVELLPVHETQNDTNDTAQASANYWGYSTLAYFAPDRRYASDQTPGGPTREMKAMVAAFHAQGIKVFLDVVYNHTAEGGVSGSSPGVAKVLSFRGLDNAAYYELAADHQTPVDDTGTGGNFNTGSAVVRDLVIDSLAYWTGAMGVDGFRFDLAAVLANSCTSACYAFAPADASGILARALGTLPAGTALIAEPWGVGTGTYQLGHFPTGWSEWNGGFRDTIREAQNELGVIPVTPSALVAKIGGSPDTFNHDGRAPSASINFVDCHDGFTLADQYAYDAPNDAQAFPLGPSTGGSTMDYPWNQGGTAAAQVKAARTGLALVGLSAGVPMFQGGDEMLRTQYGNNNAYNLDSQPMWLDWSLATTNASFVTWTSRLLAFRASHTALRPAAFRDGTDHDGNGLPDIAFLDNTGAVASAAYLANTANHFLAWRIDGAEAGDTARSIWIAWNGWTAAISMPVPAPGSTTSWWISGDSGAGTFPAVGQETALTATTVSIAARSVAVFVER